MSRPAILALPEEGIGNFCELKFLSESDDDDDDDDDEDEDEDEDDDAANQ